MMSRRSGLFTPQAHYRQPWSGELMILSPGQIPTVDFYLSSRLPQTAVTATTVYDSTQAVVADTPNAGCFVVIVRHASPDWLAYVQRHAERWSGVAYLMDDDLPGAWRCADIPWDYRLWTAWRYWRIQSLLSKVCDRLWLSTPALQARYASIPSMLLPPLPYGEAAMVSDDDRWRWGYHGTRMHQGELAWLVPVVREVQHQLPQAQFEVFGDDKVRRLFADIPRVHVIPRTSWTAYMHYGRTHPLALALAPMLPGRFNTVRSHTKAFDIVRCGAAGLFSDAPAYAAIKTALPQHVLPNDPQVWVSHIVALLNDRPLCRQAAGELAAWAQARQRADAGQHLFGAVER